MKKPNFVASFLFLSLTFCVSNLFAQNESPKIVSGGVVNGKAVSLVKPVYPTEAKEAKAEGAVNVQVTIDEAGNVISAEAVSGQQLLRKASEDAALASKFSPTKLQGQPVKVRGIIVYNFVASSTPTSAPNFLKISGGVLNGKALKLSKPKYPKEAKAVKADGPVTVEVVVNEEGKVISAKAVSGHNLLREVSEKAALKSTFSPTFLKGKAVKITGVIVYNFTAK